MEPTRWFVRYAIPPLLFKANGSLPGYVFGVWSVKVVRGGDSKRMTSFGSFTKPRVPSSITQLSRRARIRVSMLFLEATKGMTRDGLDGRGESRGMGENPTHALGGHTGNRAQPSVRVKHTLWTWRLDIDGCGKQLVWGRGLRCATPQPDCLVEDQEDGGGMRQRHDGTAQGAEAEAMADRGRRGTGMEQSRCSDGGLDLGV
jgi:hypothetical protein